MEKKQRTEIDTRKLCQLELGIVKNEPTRAEDKKRAFARLRRGVARRGVCKEENAKNKVRAAFISQSQRIRHT